MPPTPPRPRGADADVRPHVETKNQLRSSVCVECGAEARVGVIDADGARQYCEAHDPTREPDLPPIEPELPGLLEPERVAAAITKVETAPSLTPDAVEPTECLRAVVRAEDIRTYDYDGAVVRVVVDDPENPLFIAVDVCRVLDHSNPSQALARLDNDERTLITGEGLPPAGLGAVTEAGLYSLILTSRKPEAKRFKRKVTHEILPAIRKTGRYEAPTAAPRPDALPVSPEIARLQLRMMEEQRRAEKEKRLQAQHEAKLEEKKYRRGLELAEFIRRRGKLVEADSVEESVRAKHVGIDVAGFLPSSTTSAPKKWLSAAELGKDAGVSARAAGAFAKALGFRTEAAVERGLVRFKDFAVETEESTHTVDDWTQYSPALRPVIEQVAGAWLSAGKKTPIVDFTLGWLERHGFVDGFAALEKLGSEAA